MNTGIWRAAGGSRNLSLGESTALSQDMIRLRAANISPSLLNLKGIYMMVDLIVTVSMIAMFGGIGLFLFSANFGAKGSKVRVASAFLFIGGIIGGCFATPSRGMPNGMPGALAVSMLFVVIGVIMIVTAFAKKSSGESSKEKKQMTNKLLIIVAVVVFMIFI